MSPPNLTKGQLYKDPRGTENATMARTVRTMDFERKLHIMYFFQFFGASDRDMNRFYFIIIHRAKK